MRGEGFGVVIGFCDVAGEYEGKPAMAYEGARKRAEAAESVLLAKGEDGGN